MSRSFDADVRAVLDRLARVDDPVCAGTARRALARLDEPLRVAIAGRVKAGKSTLLNALIGEPVAATDATECTRLVTWYRRHHTYEAAAVRHDGSRTPLLFRRDGAAASVEVGELDERTVTRLEVGAPSPRLADLVLIDTPGINSVSDEVSQRSHAFLTPPSQGDQGADILVFLLRRLRAEDSDFLEAFTDSSALLSDPVRSIGILSRADEIGSGRGDGLVIAAEIAERYRRDPQLRQLVSEVYPVSGLLAFFAATVTDSEMVLLRELSRLPGEDSARLLASAARFGAESRRLTVPGVDRLRLLGRLGLVGVRLAVAAIRSQPGMTTGDLSSLMGELSGIEPLRQQLLSRYASRAGVLKAARGLDVAEHLARGLPNGGGKQLAGEVQRIRFNAHELRELSAIGDILSGGDDHIADLDAGALLRHLGHQGAEPAERMPGLVPGPDGLAVVARRVQQLRRVSESRGLSRRQRELIDVTTRSLELVHHRWREQASGDGADRDQM